MKYIRDFSSISDAKNATLYSPTVVNVSDGSSNTLLMSNEGKLDTELKITGDTIDTLGIEKAGPTFEYVDLGLPSGTLWATCNVGASSPEEYGLFFQWGDTTGHAEGTGSTTSYYDWSNYKYCGGTYKTLTKYNNNSSYGTVDNKLELDLSDDMANAYMGGDWKTPTKAQLEELINTDNVTINSKYTLNGVLGTLITSITNSNTLFLPYAGYCDGTSHSNVGFGTYLWSREASSSDPGCGGFLSVYSDGDRGVDYDARCYGYSVRAVL